MEKKPARGVKLFFLGYFALLILLLTGIGVMNWCGYALIDAGAVFVLFGLLLFSAFVAGAVWIVRRIRVRWLRIVSATAGVLLALLLVVEMTSVFSLLLVAQMPLPYTTLVSPGGTPVAVLRQMSIDPERIEARLAARGEVWSADTGSMDDFGYRYIAHPRVARYFYDRRAEFEGTLEIGCASAAQLMYDWPEADVLHLYIEGAQPGDAGEITLKLDARGEKR